MMNNFGRLRLVPLTLCSVFPFDGKCPDFIQLRRFSAETRMQMGEMRAFSGKSRHFPYA